jgi:hypothetical protein
MKVSSESWITSHSKANSRLISRPYCLPINAPTIGPRRRRNTCRVTWSETVRSTRGCKCIWRPDSEDLCEDIRELGWSAIFSRRSRFRSIRFFPSYILIVMINLEWHQYTLVMKASPVVIEVTLLMDNQLRDCTRISFCLKPIIIIPPRPMWPSIHI